MPAVSEVANLRKLRYKMEHLGYSVRRTPESIRHLGDYTVIENDCNEVILRGTFRDVHRFLKSQLA